MGEVLFFVLYLQCQTKIQMDFNTLLNSATRMQKKILFAFAIGVIPAYTALFFTFEKFASYIFPTQIMLSLMLSSSIVIAYLYLVFIFDCFRCRKTLSATSYEIYSVVYLSCLISFIADNKIDGIPWTFLSGAIVFATTRVISVVLFEFRANHRSDYRKVKQDYVDNAEHPKEE